MIDIAGRIRKVIEYVTATHIYDDFNDNIQNTNIWSTYTTAGSTAVSETGQQLKISNPGTGTAGYSYASTIKSFIKSLEIIADIGVTDGEAAGDGERCEAYIELYIDANNYFQFGLYRDTGEAINSRGYVTYKISGAAEVTVDVDATDIDNISRKYGIVLDEHHVHVYLDSKSNILGTYIFEGLTNYTVRLVSGTQNNTDVIDIRFDNFEVNKYSQNIRANYSKLESIQGGSESLQTLHDDHLDPILDLARSGDSGQTTMTGAELTLYEETDTTPFGFEGGYIDWTGLNAGGGENTAIRAYIKIKSGGAYVKIYEETFLAAALPDPLATPIPRESAVQPEPSKLYNTYGIKITATQAAIGIGWNILDHEWYDAKQS